MSAMSERQREDPELRTLNNFLQGHMNTVPKAFTRGLSFLLLRYNVAFKNFMPHGKSNLLGIPTALREEILQACLDEPTAGHLGFTRMLARIREKYYLPGL